MGSKIRRSCYSPEKMGLKRKDLFELDAEPVRPYTKSALIYDHMMRDVDYKSWARYLISLMKLAGIDVRRTKIKGQKLCEFGCGTGNLSLIMSRLGYDVTGVDNSKDMLSQARLKTHAASRVVVSRSTFNKRKVRFINSDMVSYRTSEQYDVAVCIYDSINYLNDEDSVDKFMANVYMALKPGGIFIFDASLESNSLNDPSLFIQRGKHKGIYYQRQSLYDPKEKIHTTRIRIKKGEKLFEEVHRERVFPMETLRKLSSNKGFIEKLAAGDFTLLEADDNSERVHFVLMKPGGLEPSILQTHLKENGET
jgi:SAM-dependent methyltransferase